MSAPDGEQLSFAKRLAHSTNKELREETVRTLSAWLAGEVQLERYLNAGVSHKNACFHMHETPQPVFLARIRSTIDTDA